MNIPQEKDVTVANALLINVSLEIAMEAKNIVTQNAIANDMIEGISDIHYTLC
jgi:hypothetical protein